VPLETATSHGFGAASRRREWAFALLSQAPGRGDADERLLDYRSPDAVCIGPLN
jgi:hypothetical protein